MLSVDLSDLLFISILGFFSSHELFRFVSLTKLDYFSLTFEWRSLHKWCQLSYIAINGVSYRTLQYSRGLSCVIKVSKLEKRFTEYSCDYYLISIGKQRALSLDIWLSPNMCVGLRERQCVALLRSAYRRNISA